MTQEDKALLLKDICARLPYGVKVDVSRVDEWKELTLTPFILSNYYDDIEKIKPYLRPLSSMTEEEKKELYGKYNVCSDTILNTLTLREHSEGYWDEDTECSFVDYLWFINWLNEHHFDYHGLIPMGLALEAPEGMYKIN